MKNDPRLSYLAEHLRALGPRPLFEFLREIVAGADPIPRLEKYGELDPDVVRLLGADQMPPWRVVDGGQQ